MPAAITNRAPGVLPCPLPFPLRAGDRLEVRCYERLSPLQAARRPLADLSQVQRGDCVVSFSRREVHAVRQEIQSHGRERCCVIYGALPPDARQLQASLFNTPRTGEGVLGELAEPDGLFWVAGRLLMDGPAW